MAAPRCIGCNAELTAADIAGRRRFCRACWLDAGGLEWEAAHRRDP